MVAVPEPATALHLAQTGNRVVAIARNPEALAECARVAGTSFLM